MGRLLRSKALALVLMAVIAPLLVVSTLVPQGLSPRRYAPLVRALGLDRVQRSLLFLVPAALLVLNLVVATADRWYTRRSSNAPRRHGPDVVHVAIVVIAIGALASMTQREALDFTLRLGDAVDVPGGWRVVLRDIHDDTGPEGRIRDWISTVDIQRDEQTVQAAREIGARSPLRLGALRLAQTGRGSEGIIRMWEGRGMMYTLRQGELKKIGDRQWRLVSIAEGRATVEEWVDNETVTTTTAGFGNTLGPYSVRELVVRPTARFTAVIDPGVTAVLVGAILGAVGLAWTFLQRRGDEG